MPVELALVLAFIIIVASIVVVAAMVQSRQRAAQEDELRQAASARGWTFEAVTEHGYRVHRWRGTTDGISWIAESLRRMGKNRRHRRLQISRWHGGWNPGINGAIVAMGLPKGKEKLWNPVAEQSENMVAKMIQKAAGFAFDQAIDAYFGSEAGQAIDAGATHRVDGERIPGFIVMAADRDEGARIMAQGFEQALISSSADPASALSDNDRPWILLRPGAISLARTEPLRDAAQLERFIHAGIGLTKAFTFGRRSPF